MHIITFKTLTLNQRNEVHEWLCKNKANPHKIRREFSDVYIFAGLLQGDFPKQIDLNNYPRRSRIALKIQNWTTFNFKVLAKHNMCLGKDLVSELARGTRGAIEVVIYEMLRLRKQLDEKRQAQITASGVKKESAEDDVKEEVKAVEQIQDEAEAVVVAEDNKDEALAAEMDDEDFNNIVQATSRIILSSIYDDVYLDHQKLTEDKIGQVDKEVEVEAVEQAHEEPGALVTATVDKEAEEAVPVNIDNDDIDNIMEATSRMILYSIYEDMYLEGQEKDSAINVPNEEVKAVEQIQDEADAPVTLEESQEDPMPADIYDDDDNDDDINNTVQATSRMILRSLYEDIFTEGNNKDEVIKMWNDRMTSLESELKCKQDRLREMSEVIATLPEDIQRLFKPVDN